MTKKHYAIEFSIDTNPKVNTHTLCDILDAAYQQIFEGHCPDSEPTEFRLKDNEGKSIGCITVYKGE